MEIARVLACRSVRIASKASENTKKYLREAYGLKCSYQRMVKPADAERFLAWQHSQVLSREAAIWNMVAVLAKRGAAEKVAQHAPVANRQVLLRKALKRWTELQEWTQRNQQIAQALAKPLIEEYKKREESRQQRLVASGGA